MKAYVIVCRNGDAMWVHDKTFTTIDERPHMLEEIPR